MGIPVWAVGQVLAASDVNTWFVPLAPLKPSDTTITNSTALANDPDLFIPVASVAAYSFTCFLDYEGGTQGSSDLKVHFTVPAGTTMRYHRKGIDTTGASTIGFLANETSTFAAGSAGASSLKAVEMQGTIVTASTAGNVQLQWAQNTSNATSTIVHGQSNLIAFRIS